MDVYFKSLLHTVKHWIRYDYNYAGGVVAEYW